MGDGFKIGNDTHGIDDLGEFGTVLDDDEHEVPEPFDFTPPPPPGVAIQDDLKPDE